MTKAFVHGNPETAAIWGPLTRALADRGTDDIVLLSPPGFGAPTAPGWDASPANYVGWLVGELEGLGGDVDLVGHDWGAGHVYGVVAERPDLVRSWAADCGGLTHPDYAWHDMAQTWQMPGAGEEAIELMLAIPPDDRTAMYTGLGMPEPVAAELARALDPEMGRCILGLYRGAAQPALRDLGDRLAAADRPPGLIIDPTEDVYVGTDLVPAVAARFRVEVLRLEGRGHWWMFDDLDPVAEGLTAFWAGVT